MGVGITRGTVHSLGLGDFAKRIVQRMQRTPIPHRLAAGGLYGPPVRPFVFYSTSNDVCDTHVFFYPTSH